MVERQVGSEHYSVAFGRNLNAGEIGRFARLQMMLDRFRPSAGLPEGVRLFMTLSSI